jgi:hypothetical protein
MQSQVGDIENRLAATESRLEQARYEISESEDTVTRAKKAMAIALTLLDQNDQPKMGTKPVGTQPGDELEERTSVS